MREHIDNYINFLTVVKRSSQNTIASYKRDLLKLNVHFESKGYNSILDINAMDLNNYVLDMKSQGMSLATISRNVASIKSFFLYL